jgi:L,D-transpeptidase ErfK/SrfK
MRTSSVRFALALCLALTTGACASPAPMPRSTRPARPQKLVRAAPPALPLPVQTEKFMLAPGQTIIGRLQVVKVLKGQTLTDIGRRFNLGYEEMKRANPDLSTWLPPLGAPVLLPTEFILPDAPHKGIVVNVAAMRLFYFPPHKPGEPQIVITHPVGIGRAKFPTPIGVTHVVAHQKGPVWVVPRSILAEHTNEGAPLPPVVGPGPLDPLGNYALQLGWPEILLHGTNKPVSVGWPVSHGCIHMFPEDIKQLFYLVPNGTELRTVDQPYLFGWRNGRLYMVAYGPLKGSKRPWKTDWRQLLPSLITHAERVELRRHGQKIDWTRVGELVANPRGVPVPVSGKESGGLAHVLADATWVQNRLPAGSTWNGKAEGLATNAQFRKFYAGILTPEQRRALEAVDSLRKRAATHGAPARKTKPVQADPRS